MGHFGLSVFVMILHVSQIASGRNSAGVAYALDALSSVTDARVSLETDTSNLPAGLDLPQAESFALARDRSGFRVWGTTSAALQYGVLELRDRLLANEPPDAPEISSPTLHLRGDIMDFPFYLGVDLYNGRWATYAKTETATASAWLDHAGWTRRLQVMAERRLNALLLCHPHPFPALIDLPDHPESAWFDPETLRRHQTHFRWLLSQAAEFGVRVYFLTWNIWTSPGFAQRHSIAMEGTDLPQVRDYTRVCYQRLFQTFPQLAGVMTMAGEAPPGCVDFVEQAVIEGLNLLPEKPELLFWTWCSYPEDALRIRQAYHGPFTLVHYLQYEQLFRPQADPRIRWTSEAVGDAPVVTLGGLGTATGWLYWSDPFYLRALLADLPRQNGVGCFFQGLDSFGWVAPKWLGWEALARYTWDPQQADSPAYWARRVELQYGVREIGADFLDASVAASAIPTRLLALLHRQTDHHLPQFGLPLVHYLGLPTLSTYVFENHTSIDEQGRLVPRMGLTWPNPDWGERVIGIVDYVAGATQGTTPIQIASELEQSATRTLAAVGRMRPYSNQVSAGTERFERIMDQLEMNAHLGTHTAAKIRAAVAWQRWRQGQAAPHEVLEPLQQSVSAMERMANAAARCYPNARIHAWRSCISRPIPWTHLHVWNSGRYREHDFAASVALFRNELAWIAQELEAGYPQPLLPFEDDLLPMPQNARRLLAWDFEVPQPPQVILGRSETGNTHLTQGEAPAPFAGQRLVATHTGTDHWFPLTTAAGALPLRTDRKYRLALDYWIVRCSSPEEDWLAAGLRTARGGWEQDVGQRFMGGPAGTRGRLTITGQPVQWDDYAFFVSIHGPAVVEFDNLEIWEGE